MAELSIIEKVKAYDEAKYIMKEYLESGNAGVIAENTIKKAFPELAGSEDDRIRKELIKFVKVNIPDQERYIAWLEKPTDTDNKFTRMRETKPKDISEFLDRLTTVEQEFLWEHIAKIRELDKEEKKPTVIIPKFRIGDYVKNVNDKREPIYEIVYMDKECYVCEYRGKENMGDKAVMHFAFDNPYLRLVEQNPVDNVEKPWSEDDNKHFERILKELKNQWQRPSNRPYLDEIVSDYYWLNSIKDRYTWKPSDEQMENLSRAFNSGTFRTSLLMSLYQDLKKLREE